MLVSLPLSVHGFMGSSILRVCGGGQLHPQGTIGVDGQSTYEPIFVLPSVSCAAQIGNAGGNKKLGLV